MPFLSPDWRYPGDRWLRSSENGSLWESAKVYRQRMLQKMNETVIKRVCRQSLDESVHFNENYVNEILRVVVYQPHVHLRPGSVHEVSTTTTISEAILELDMKAAIRDIRRFNYVCKIIQILVSNHFHKLTGRLQLFLIELLRTILVQVQASCNQTAMLQNLLTDLATTLDKYKYDHIGSAVLWRSHLKAVEDMNKMANDFDIEERLKYAAAQRRIKPRSVSETCSSSGRSLTLEQLPPECLSHVLSFVDLPQDLETASLASASIANLVKDDSLWRDLTLAHFDMKQMSSVHFGRAGWRDEPPATIEDCNWKRAYVRLLKRYGDQHLYTSKLALCEVCFCLFWSLFGHPCYYPQQPERLRLLSPEDFIGLFSI
ncbi:unnamed protein product [Calicophoron daubneyi]|uniref:F-box domain-containing protein n=1 Tax=Calicophoron daubneyi TaxID=300641 RepID=A0AAV2T6T6_CALDB